MEPVTTKSSTTLTATPDIAEKTPLKVSDPIKIDVTRLPSGDDDYDDIEPTTTEPSRTVLHIYFEHPCNHKLITPVLSASQERRFGPTARQQKERRSSKKAERKLREADKLHSVLTAAPLLPDVAQPDGNQEGGYFLHAPYLSFHMPPFVLYTGSSRYAPATPVALVQTGCFWRTYKIQLGPSLALPGVIDPRGVVSWAHNGGSAKDLKADERALKGYKVRGWRLWGESGKKYVHSIRDARKAGLEFQDPDVIVGAERKQKVRADDVVHLRWMRPLSRQTRLYTFTFHGMQFQWKGTGTVSEGRKCGWMLRFCHLKLVVKVPADALGNVEETREVCLGKYTSSIAAEKSGTLEVFDAAVVRFVEEWMPSLLEEEGYGREKGEGGTEDEAGKIAILKKSTLYQLFVATVLCMANAEKEKRHTLMDLVIGIAENGGNGGG